MIADPILINGREDWNSTVTTNLRNSSKPILFYDHRLGNADRWIGIVDSRFNEPFAVALHVKVFYLDSRVKTKEQFFLFLESNYPEHYEWFLWNLELL
jgi:hypothetical protein